MTDPGRRAVQEDVEDTVIRPRSGLVGTAGEDTVIRPGSGLVQPVVPAPVPDPPRRVAAVRIGDRVVPLDRPVILGRRPAPPRVLFGPPPTLVTVGRPRGQVSGSHLSVRTEGGAVVVEDLRSTNGTIVRPPWTPPYRLPSGASRVVLTGTLVDIGDGVTIEILSPHLRAGEETAGVTVHPGSGLPPTPGTPITRERS